jgi:hypothetical protein
VSNSGCTRIGSAPLTTTPATTALYALRDSSSFSPGPATASEVFGLRAATSRALDELIGQLR